MIVVMRRFVLRRPAMMDPLGVVSISKPRVLFLDIRQEALQALVLLQKSVVSRAFEPPPHLCHTLYGGATEPNGDADEAEHRQNQCAETEHLFHHQFLQAGHFLLSITVPAHREEA